MIMNLPKASGQCLEPSHEKLESSVADNFAKSSDISRHDDSSAHHLFDRG